MKLPIDSVDTLLILAPALTSRIPSTNFSFPSFLTDNENCRPISLLTNFSKIFERVMYKHLITFVEQYEILYCYQFGFRKNHSTSMALIHLVNKITSAINCKETTAGVFLDLSKAFDTIDHDILFDKLEHYGISGIALTWIKSYFFERKQFVEFNQTCSSEQTIKCGVPQGSILRPLFFI